MSKKKNNKDIVAKKIEIDKESKNNDLDNTKKGNNRGRKSFIGNLLFCITILVSILYFGLSIYNFNNLGDIINGLLILIFTFIFISVISGSLSIKKKTKLFSVFILLCYQVFAIINILNLINMPGVKVMENFVDRSLTDVVEFATKNKITLNQEYEYSDMIDEYNVIVQDVKPGTKLSKVNQLTVSVSEGFSPYKEIVIPNMIGWDTDRVLEFILKNHLSNVDVEFVSANENENTLIEQSMSGNLKRNEELKLKFSYGEERHYSEVKLRDLVNKSKFEAEFYLKQNGIKYEIDYDFSSKIKRGYVIRQDVKAGSMISINGDDVKTVKITISKGPEIKVPNLKGMSLDEITAWVIKNKLKIEFKDSYDDTVKENDILDVNYKKGDVIEEESRITVTLSKGKLVMPQFKNLTDFKDWADSYNIKYEEQHEFNDDVKAGDVIRYSYDSGSTIKNGDTIIVVISDGKKVSVPNLNGMSKTDVEKRLGALGLAYNFVYKYSNNVEKGKVISQSISASSEVSTGTTITVTLSNGKAPINSSNKGGSTSSNNNNNNNNTSSNTTTPAPSCDIKTTVYLYEELYDLTNPSNTCSKIKNKYPNVKFNCSYTSGPTNGLVSNANSIDGKTFNNCDSVSLVIWRN